MLLGPYYAPLVAVQAGALLVSQPSTPSPHISQNRAHRGSESAKVVVVQRLCVDSRKPRCRQSVAQKHSILERWQAALWKPHLMRDWSRRMRERYFWEPPIVPLI